MAEKAPVEQSESALNEAEVTPQPELSIQEESGGEAWKEVSQQRDSVKARYDGLIEELDRPENSKDIARIEQNRQTAKADRREYAKLTLDLWRKGGIEKLEASDLALIAEDIAELGADSAIAEIVLSRHGFNNAQDALRKLKLDKVAVGKEFDELDNEVGDKIIAKLEHESGLKKFWRSPAVREQLQKAGISAGVSATVAGVITILGGPVSLATLGLGVAGSIGGRALGELWRSKALKKEVKDSATDGEIAFNEKVGRDLFELIVSLQGRAREVINESDSANNRADSILELVQRANQIESRSQKDYQRLEKNFKWVKMGLSVLGAVSGGALGSWITSSLAEGKASMVSDLHKEAFEKAKTEGIRIWHDPTTKVAHLIMDEGNGHVVKQTVDGAWRYVIEQNDVSDLAKVAAEKGDWVKDFYHYYVTPEQITDNNIIPGVDNVVPDVIRLGEQLQHAGTISEGSITSAIEGHYGSVDKIYSDALFANWSASVAVGAGVGAAEGFGFWQDITEHKRHSEIKKDNEALLDSIEEVEAMLRSKRGEFSLKLPADKAEVKPYLEKLAAFYKVALPEAGQKWYATSRDGQPILIGGEASPYEVAEANPEANSILLNYPTSVIDKKTGTTKIIYTQRTMKLSDFLKSHRLYRGEKNIFQTRKSSPSNENTTGNSEGGGRSDEGPSGPTTPTNDRKESPKRAGERHDQEWMDRFLGQINQPRSPGDERAVINARKPVQENKSGRVETRMVSREKLLPKGSSEFTPEQWYNYLTKSIEGLDESVLSDTSIKVGQKSTEGEESEFIKHIDRNGNEHTLKRSHLANSGKLTIGISKRKKDSDWVHYTTATNESLELYALHILREIKRAKESSGVDTRVINAAPDPKVTSAEKNKEPDNNSEVESEQTVVMAPTQEIIDPAVVKGKAPSEPEEGSRSKRFKSKVSEKEDLGDLEDDDPDSSSLGTPVPIKKPEAKPKGPPTLSKDIENLINKTEVNPADIEGLEFQVPSNKVGAESVISKLQEKFQFNELPPLIDLKVEAVDQDIDGENKVYNYTVTLSHGDKSTKLKFTEAVKLLSVI